MFLLGKGRLGGKLKVMQYKQKCNIKLQLKSLYFVKQDIVHIIISTKIVFYFLLVNKMISYFCQC